MTERFRDHPARAELLALYKEVDALQGDFTCDLSQECCSFGEREPYPTTVELAEVWDAVRTIGGLPKKRTGRGRLPLVNDELRCPLLGPDGRCRIYASRPFGCRTFFCARVQGPGKLPRKEVQSLGQRVAQLSARVFRRDPRPRSFRAALEAGEGALERCR